MKEEKELKIKFKSDKQQVIGTDFSTEFLKLENNNKNMVYSPLSMK